MAPVLITGTTGVAFACWGYMNAFAPALKIVRALIARYDVAVIPHFKLSKLNASRKARSCSTCEARGSSKASGC